MACGHSREPFLTSVLYARLAHAGGGSEFCFLMKKAGHPFLDVLLCSGAGDEARTRYLHLGKVALYQMSYTRKRQTLL